MGGKKEVWFLALFACLLISTAAGAPPRRGLIEVPIQPNCKFSFYGPDISGKPDRQPWDPTTAKPFTYKDLRTEISFYVESDGRHVAAIGPDGKLLWVRNPFEDAKLCPYRSARPVIRSLVAFPISPAYAKDLKLRGANPNHFFLSIFFDSSQFGKLDETNGAFLFEGQN